MPYIGETDKATRPNRFVSQRIGVEACREILIGLNPDRHGPRYHFGLTDQNIALHRTQVDLVPLVTLPSILFLIPPVSELTSIKTWKRLDPSWSILHRRKVQSLFGVPIVNPIAIDKLHVVWVVLGVQRRSRPSKLRRFVSTCRSNLSFEICQIHRVGSQAHKKAKQVCLLAQRQRLKQTCGHQRSTRCHLLDRIAPNRLGFTSGRIDEHQRRSLWVLDIPR